jgi:signal transduction histidine kinase
MAENCCQPRRRGSISLEDERADVRGERDGSPVEVAELRASRERLALAIDAERRSIERALHDGVQQQLVGLAADIELAAAVMDTDPVAAKKLLSDVRRDTRQLLEEARALAHRIYPPLLEAGGLIAALRTAAATANVHVQIDVAVDEASPSEIAGAVYFSCVDVLQRVGRGSRVAIAVRDEEGAVTFEIVADGEVDLGRLPLRDRVEAMGGQVTIRSGSGDRTRVAGSLPLPR